MPLLNKFISSINDRVPDPFEGLFDMPCSVIVSGAGSGDQLPHTDVSTAPHMLPACARNPSSCHISTFVALSPQYRINVQAGTALGEATEERWDEVLLQQGEVLVLASPARYHGLPSPPGQEMQGARSGPPIGVIRGSSRIRRILTPPSPWSSRTASACWTGRAGRTCPLLGNICCWGLDWRLGWGLPPRTWWTTSSAPPRWSQAPPVCTHHPLFLSRSARDITPVIVHAGEILMWNVAYEMEVVKGNSTDRDVVVTWALGATLPPTHPAPAWQLLHAVLEWKRAKESKKGTWTVTCPCECEVCIVFYPVFARTLRHCAAHSQMLQIRSGMQIHEFRAKFARISHE